MPERRFLLSVEDDVYGAERIAAEVIEQAINVELDDAFSPYITVRELTPEQYGRMTKVSE